MDAEINHGNSGGPVCNEEGEVIGIATFGSIESNSGTLAAGMNFSIPVTILKDFLDSLRIEPQQGKASLLFNNAMDDYDKEEYRDALKKLKRLQKLNSSFPGLSPYISNCKIKIDSGLDKTEKQIKLWLMAAGLVLITLLLALLWKRWTGRKTVFNHTRK
jgi:hypothetical protein